MDGKVVAGDALAVINYINVSGSGPVPDFVPSGPPYYDTDDDDNVAPGDALMIINFINANGAGLPGPAGEGEAAPNAAPLDALYSALDDHSPEDLPANRDWLALLLASANLTASARRTGRRW